MRRRFITNMTMASLVEVGVTFTRQLLPSVYILYIFDIFLFQYLSNICVRLCTRVICHRRPTLRRKEASSALLLDY